MSRAFAAQFGEDDFLSAFRRNPFRLAPPFTGRLVRHLFRSRFGNVVLAGGEEGGRFSCGMFI